MGCPENYYRDALQRFAYSVVCSDKKRAKQLLNEYSIEKLENEIKVQKDKLDIKEFIYTAGMIGGMVLESANRDDGCDGFNACMGGLYEFENFVKNLWLNISN